MEEVVDEALADAEADAAGGCVSWAVWVVGGDWAYLFAPVMRTKCWSAGGTESQGAGDIVGGVL